MPPHDLVLLGCAPITSYQAVLRPTRGVSWPVLCGHDTGDFCPRPCVGHSADWHQVPAERCIPTKSPIPAKAESNCCDDGDPPRVYTQITIGTSGLGQTTAISPAASLALLPVLSPITQLLGSPARKRLSPVRQPTNQSVRVVRDASDRTDPRTRRRSVFAMAAGVVVSRGSPGGVRFRNGSGSSSRLI